ncbi:uncharacterized protein LOC132739706 isoform X2 [Ruditapes philippinarum]|uniref:uncharacterized protein LOC132739706 isoform X2 n=1 Tax=Ruditapes philippinarum TaxID=129788 RepID=UPI00295AEA22|nr:uncharacterized protein LOC132739706 isoform X2 [Ruditapes philippinarum]
MPSTNSAETLNQEFVSVKRSRSANGAQLTKLYNELERSMMSFNNIEEVKLLNSKLCERFEHFKSVHLQCLDLCAQPEVVADLEANFESCLKNFEEFRERFSQWIAGAIGPHDGENIPVENDAESNVSHGSSRTSVSSRRKLQSAKAKRLIAEHKLKQLKKKQELERARRDLEMKQQLLDQQSKLEEAEIEEMVWLETTQEETGVISNNQNAQPDVQNNMTNHIQVNNRTDSVRNITLTQPRPEINRSCIPEVDSETSNIDRSFQRLASALHEGFNLPKPELLTFDGKPEGYCKFIKNFETNIESRISDNNLKLSYLIQYCTGNCAELSLCNKFKSMSLNDRYKLVRSLKLCYNCLKGKHFTNKCRKPKMCNVTNCNVKHHILLHSWVKPDNGHTAVQSSCNCAATEGSTVKNCLGIIPVIVKGGDGSSCQTYALLDDGADKTLCDERLLRSLNITGKPVTFRMSTANSREGIIHGQEADLDIQPIDGNESITVRKVWSVKSLPISTRSAAKYADIRNLPYLSGINIPDIDTNDVMMLIGTDSPVAHIPLEVKFGNSDEPYAIRTRLGWAIRGPVPTMKESNDININFFESRDMLLQQQIERLWTTDFNDKSQVKSCMSVEDKNAMKSMESTLTREDGHYKLGLPWRDRNSSFVNNIPLAQARLQQLKRKLSNDNNLHDMYRTTVNDYIANGYASEVDHIVPETKRVWYLPHHPVINVNKPGKLCVVFDCAAKYKGMSLNSQLLQGPDLMNSLVGVLIKFRQERIAFIADIEAMFHQVRVIEEDRDALRFLWWPNGELDKIPKQYCMNVHLFGATSSPSCAAYALKRTAKDFSHLFKPEVALTVEKNFYVDDCLKSVPSEQEAIDLAMNLKKMLSLGGFRLTKWRSNSRNVLKTIPESDLAKSVVSLTPGEKCNDKALGIIWDVNNDTIKYKVDLKSNPSTRRGILSTLSSIFDPLGLVSPIILKAKFIIQNLCREKLGWDEQIPDNYDEEWQSWLHFLPRLADITIDRCFLPPGFGSVINAQLHIFSDGSEVGYGACAYLRLTDNTGNITCCLVIVKSRLAPIKQITIPRLELSGAVVACRLYQCLAEELDIKIDEVTFWTDSMILLGYIRNTSRRFKTFVGNRLSIIHDTTSPNQWHHIDSSSNPADIASRGINASETDKLDVWLHGPTFLSKGRDHWPKYSGNNIPEVSEDDVEVKREIAINVTTCDTIGKIIEYYSDWFKLRRAVAWFLRYKDYCKQRYLHHDVVVEKGNLTLSELKTSSHAVVKYVQMECFADEVINLQKGTNVKGESPIASLNPILKDGLIRTKGRIIYHDETKCPIILPETASFNYFNDTFFTTKVKVTSEYNKF